ncbi:hypothetical protein A8924_6642 [Saccharopolyspora erythraea NRRL 2338]|uniref:Uncharacterized protein n=2 Tax=Saccharopolyspora erythraea TaxID=1836 RepID=A4FN41_SACEN|nr:hypothetical protein [Saccharopolyspora erythraea]PFG99107.1 hypothetical protein A8924_6642 [Saccharopolyspora erythraea NRRL 2338]CAM05466.1 hypothetical protein SACE_6294 [Saccharopolyspora erythraea NRRL 2338]
MLCSALGKLTVKTWVLLPLLFLGSAVGIAALFEVLVSPSPGLFQDVTASVPVLCGFAGALTLLSSGQVGWSAAWQRRWLRFGYPLAVLLGGLAADAVRVPLVAALVIGPPAATLLIVVLVRSAARPVACP